MRKAGGEDLRRRLIRLIRGFASKVDHQVLAGIAGEGRHRVGTGILTGIVDQQLLLWNEYLVGDNRILKAQL